MVCIDELTMVEKKRGKERKQLQICAALIIVATHACSPLNEKIYIYVYLYIYIYIKKHFFRPQSYNLLKEDIRASCSHSPSSF